MDSSQHFIDTTTLENEEIENEINEDDDDIENEFDENLFYTDKLENTEDDNININEKKIKIIDNKERKSIPILTKYEISRIISIRSSQIENGAKPCIEINDNNNKNSIEIAKLELLMGESPLILRRRLYDNYYEEWKVKELKIINKEIIKSLLSKIS